MLKITIIEELATNDITAWTVEVDNNDYWEFIRKYIHDGHSTRGTAEEVLSEVLTELRGSV